MPRAASKKTEAPHKRQGIRTSEFWLAAITSALSLAVLAGWVDLADGTTTVDKVGAMVAMALSSLGYTVGRSWIKKKGAEAE